jgi:hypothetical protein
LAVLTASSFAELEDDGAGGGADICGKGSASTCFPAERTTFFLVVRRRIKRKMSASKEQHVVTAAEAKAIKLVPETIRVKVPDTPPSSCEKKLGAGVLELE